MKKRDLFTIFILIIVAVSVAVIKMNSGKIATNIDQSMKILTEEKINPIVKKDSPAESPVSDSTEMTSVEFKKLTDDILNTMPKKKQMQNLDDKSVHHFPKEVLEAGQKLGHLREILQKSPHLQTEALDFYKKCSGDDTNMSSVRALCLTHLIKAAKEKGESPDLSQYPENVVELAKMAVDI